MKVVLNLWDGVRYDAIYKVGMWMNLPNLWRVINGGVLFDNVYTNEPVLTPAAVGRILHSRRGTPISQLLWRQCRKSSCYVGYPEDDSHRNNFPKFPHCKVVDCLYDRRKEAHLLRTQGSLHRHRHTYPDHYRASAAIREIPHHDFSFVYFAKPDEGAHACRDTNRHVYAYGSPYIHAIKECDNQLGRLLHYLDTHHRNDYVIIIVADHGMTNNGRHSIAKWDDEEVMHVPLAIMGKGIRHHWVERERYYTHDLTSGIIGLFKHDAKKTMFRWALA